MPHPPSTERFHALDAVRGLALLVGVAFHAGFSFLPGLIPGIWAINDRSPSTTLAVLLFTSHVFRMSLFFFVAGFFARLLFVRRGARGFWANRAKRILVPLVAFWPIVFPAIAAVWVWGLTKTFGGTLPAAPPQAPAAPPGAFPLTHLWFLYVLLVLYVPLVCLRSTVAALDTSGRIRGAADALVGGAVRGGLAAPLLAVPVALALFLRRDWIAWFGVPTPDQSLIPNATALAAYGTAIAFGWLAHRQTGLLDVWRRQWPVHLAAALAATAVCLLALGPTPPMVPASPGWSKLLVAAAYALAVWCWIFALVGLAMRFLADPRPIVRYISDASYWIYIAHLPVVVALQVAIGHAGWHWSLKFPFILAVSLGVLFASYHYVVRSTLVGQLLNGRRHPRGLDRSPAAPGTLATPSAAEPNHREPDEPTTVASLRGVHKRYGQTLALDGVDLDVRPGELLALLGPNGAGKSTAIAIWLGLLEPDGGRARLFDGSPLEVGNRRRIGVMMQDVGLTPEMRVRELIDLTSRYYPDPLPVDATLQVTRLTALADRRYSTLSGGQKRQVQFALAICGRPMLLFLDEPSVGLDVEAREAMWQALRSMVAGGCSVVLTTHHLEEAEALASRVAVLAGGRLIASGSVDEIRSTISRTEISCASDLAEDDVRGWPEVVAVARDTDRLRITAVAPESVVRRLLNADAGLRHLQVRPAGLADAVTALTKEVA
jgi:ABC-type multidrug transport system ATPase subunit/peptidoglycan/LPS O-acetylase OafA/YrhL